MLSAVCWGPVLVGSQLSLPGAGAVGAWTRGPMFTGTAQLALLGGLITWRGGGDALPTENGQRSFRISRALMHEGA